MAALRLAHVTATASSATTEDQRKDVWSSLLSEVATGKQFPQKNLLVLGDSAASQKAFVESLSNCDTRQKSKGAKVPEIANSFALGNTYYDVLDGDQEQDILARVSVYLFSQPSPPFHLLIRPLLTAQTIPNTLVVVLLNWSRPWTWLRELRQWILLLKKAIYSLSHEEKLTLDDVLQKWKLRGRAGSLLSLDGSSISAQNAEGEAALLIGQGEWDEGLGLPLCVVCQNAEKMDNLEKGGSWKEEQFDIVLQYMRTVLLKHGASLIYTSPSLPSQLQNLVHSSLGVKSLASKNDPSRHNTIDRDKILVPPNWDSWSKIRILRDGFDTERVSMGWSSDIFTKPSLKSDIDESSGATNSQHITNDNELDPENSAVLFFEAEVPDPSFDAQLLASQADESAKFEDAIDTQTFLEAQQHALEALKQKPEPGGDSSRRPKDDDSSSYLNKDTDIVKKIGPVQVNVGGIHVGDDDMVQRLKDQALNADSMPSSGQDRRGPSDASAESGAAIPGALGSGADSVVGQSPENTTKDMQQLQAFFTGLMARKDPRTKAGMGT